MKIRTRVLLLIAAVGLPGCAALDHAFCAPHCRAARSHSSSSLVEFLYPRGEVPPAENSTPELRVPLRVGLAFLPSQGGNASEPTAAQRAELLERIRARFTDRKFVGEIVLIPDYYLRDRRGFEGLQAVQRLYTIDLLALVSYDQVMHLDDNNWSLGYLTIVGAYVLKGSRHDVSTLVDLAVVDPATRSLVLRAGGTSTRHGNTTLIDREREVRSAGADGLAVATEQMIEHFDAALTRFEADVRAGKANVRVASRRSSGSSGGGGGAFGAGWLNALLLLALGSKRRAR